MLDRTIDLRPASRGQRDSPQNAGRVWYSPAVLGPKPEYQPSTKPQRKSPDYQGFPSTGATGLEPAASGVTGRRSNQLSYAPA